MGLLVGYVDDGITVLTTVSRDVFVSSRRIGIDGLELALCQQAPTDSKKEEYKYTLSLAVNQHLLETLKW
ncbi:hypothetical protein EYS14_06035 [Alteromonadaceae bacterium M269]|nr:hypothetical protein EYS14_06035 [Alteromonadaceae bacterium M269]